MFNKSKSLLVFFFVFLILCGRVHCSREWVADPVFDGVDLKEKDESSSFYNNNNVITSSFHNNNNIITSSFWSPAEELTCKQSYGFLPCTTTALGNLFLILVYGFLMFNSANFLSIGSELLLEILGPGLVGGLLLPMLGALPDAMLIFVSGLSGTREVAQTQISVGMGLLAGSTVMLLTLIWGTCIVVGKCDIENFVAKDLTDTKGFSVTGSGVSTDVWTSYAAIIMTISIIPFLIIQIPQLLISSTSGRHLAVLIGLIASMLLLISYCLYQVFQPWIQTRRLDYAKHKHVISVILKHLNTSRRLLNEHGKLDVEVMSRLFDKIDADRDRKLSTSEIRALIIGINFDEIDLDSDDAANKVMADFDTNNRNIIEKSEFIHGISRWLEEAMHRKNKNKYCDPLDEFHEQTKKDLLGHHYQSEEVIEGVESPKTMLVMKAVLYLLLGTAIAAAFANPLVDVVDNFSIATSIPKFFISFVALPLATASEVMSTIAFASRKKKITSSLTFSVLYGAVTMKNVLCLSVFLALIYVRGLTWDFSSEVLIIFIVCTTMGLFGSLRTTFPLWTASIAILLYPFSIALVFVLDYFLGWA